MKLATAEQLRRIDSLSIERYGIPGAALMETAGAGAAREVLAAWPRSSRRGVLVLAGRGNNGGDGFVVARHLAAAGRDPVVMLLDAARAELRGDAKIMAEAWVAAGGPLRERATSAEVEAAAARAGVVIDALLGSGARGAPRGAIAEAIEALGRAQARAGEARARVAALDVPSGVDGSTGEIAGAAVRADRTIAFGAPMLGLFTHPGARNAGRVVVVPLGWPAAARDTERATAETLEGSAMRALLPALDTEAHKGSRGRVLIVAGRDDRPGAAALAALAALRAGAGTVTLATTARAATDVVTTVPEVMPEPLAATDGEIAVSAAKKIAALAERADSVAIGPGLGTGAGPEAALRALVAGRVPLVVDADAITILARLGDVALAAPCVLTPHPGEMARLRGTATGEIQARRVHHAREAAARFGTVLLKGARTLIADRDGRLAINRTGNPGLATAGAGDVLSGVVCALLARGLSPRDAACLGAWAHGAAADLAAREIARAGFLAHDVADRIPRALAPR